MTAIPDELLAMRWMELSGVESESQATPQRGEARGSPLHPVFLSPWGLLNEQYKLPW